MTQLAMVHTNSNHMTPILHHDNEESDNKSMYDDPPGTTAMTGRYIHQQRTSMIRPIDNTNGGVDGKTPREESTGSAVASIIGNLRITNRDNKNESPRAVRKVTDYI